MTSETGLCLALLTCHCPACSGASLEGVRDAGGGGSYLCVPSRAELSRGTQGVLGNTQCICAPIPGLHLLPPGWGEERPLSWP